MSWYTEADGTIVVTEDCDRSREHIGFQMGTMRRYDGKLVLLDADLLSMCGERIKPPAGREEGLGETNELVEAHKGAMALLKRKVPDGCPRSKRVCRFWNEVFSVCSIARRWKAQERERAPCVTARA